MEENKQTFIFLLGDMNIDLIKIREEQTEYNISTLYKNAFMSGINIVML